MALQIVSYCRILDLAKYKTFRLINFLFVLGNLFYHLTFCDSGSNKVIPVWIRLDSNPQPGYFALARLLDVLVDKEGRVLLLKSRIHCSEEREEVKEKLHEVSLEEILEKQAIQQAQKEETDRLR